MNQMTSEKIKEMAEEIRSFLIENRLWIDITIYFNGIAFSTDDRDGHFAYNDPENLIVLEDEDPKWYFDYADGILSMSFEGELYGIINYGYCPEIIEKFDAIIEKYGCYYELGNAWNLSVYQK